MELLQIFSSTPERLLGGFVRDHRLKKGLSLRKFSKAVELSSTFVSRMERDDVNPPSEGKIINIEKVLSVDLDCLTLMARKIPADIQQMLFDKPMLVRVLRVASKKSDDELERLFGDA